MSDTPGDGATLYEEKRPGEYDPSSTVPSLSTMPSSHHVNVARAEEEFNALSRQLTVTSQMERQKSKASSGTAEGKDIEKGGDTSEGYEQFNLREYLTSSNDANQQAGIKHKVRRRSCGRVFEKP